MLTKMCEIHLVVIIRSFANRRNVYDKNAVAIKFDDCISKKIVVHIPFNWSKLASMFLKVPSSCLHGTVTGKRVNRGVGLGLEIPMDYTFYVDALEKAFK